MGNRGNYDEGKIMKSIRDLVIEIAEKEAKKEFTPEQIDAAKSEYIKDLEQKLAIAKGALEDCESSPSVGKYATKALKQLSEK